MNGKKGKAVSQEDESDDFLFEVNLTVNDKQLTVDIDKKLHIPSIDVLTPQKACNMMAENASLHARWDVLANRAIYEADIEKVRFEVWVKEKSRVYRTDLTQELGKRVTDKQVEEAVISDPEYLRRFSSYLKKKENSGNIKSIARGFGERGDRLVNIVSLMKWEKPLSSVRSSRQESDDEMEKSAFTDDESTNN